MAEDKKTIGVFWGQHHLYFLELLGTTPSQTFSLPLNPPAEQQPPLPAGAKRAALLTNLPIKEKLYFHNITSNIVNLALPTKEIIFRSFIIPWMQSNELKQAVQFEARKYLPFNIDELLYTFHSIQIQEGGERHLRIIFVAIKKDALENYTNTFDIASVQTPVVEPGAISLVRAFLFKKIITDTEASAIVEKDKTSGKIVIVDKGIPRFVREFHLHSIADNDAPLDDNATNLRLINEIRISLDYFNRQETDTEVKNVLLLTTTEESYTVKAVKEELNIATTGLTGSQVLGIPGTQELGLVHAFGAALSDAYPLAADFSLIKRKSESPRAFPKTSNVLKTFNFKSVLMTAGVCAGVLFLVFNSSKQMVKQSQSTITALKEKLGIMEGAAVEKLKTDNTNIQAKLTQAQGIRIDSDVAFLLKTIPTLLPEGAWLKSMEVVYPDSVSGSKRNRGEAPDSSNNPNIYLDGHVYLDDTKGQITVVNQLLRNLKQRQEFSQLFKSIALDTVRVEKIEDFNITSFRIICD